MIYIARLLVILGAILLVIGALLYGFTRMGIPFGQLPGDIRLERGNATCVLALGTSILLSFLITVILNIIVRIWNK